MGFADRDDEDRGMTPLRTHTGPPGMPPLARPPVFALILALSAAAPARADKFRYRFVPGQVIQSRASLAGASMTGQPGGQMMKSRFRMVVRQIQRVRSVAGGVATLEITDVPVSSSVEGLGRRDNSLGKPTKSLVRVTERGRFLSRKSLSGGPDGGSGLEGADALYGLNFPDRDLKPGDTWEDTIPVGTGAEAQQVRMTCRFVGRENFRGKSCARFSSAISLPLSAGGMPSGMPAPQGRLSGTVTTYFDPKAGVEVYSSGALVMTARADLTSVRPDAGEFVSVTKMNMVQALQPGPRRK